MAQTYRRSEVQPERSAQSMIKDQAVVTQATHPGTETGALVPTTTSVSYDAKLRPVSDPATVVSSNKLVNQKAEAFAEAHRGRVEAEAQAYLEAENRKVEARAQKLQAKAERQRMHDESKALEGLKKEEQRADHVVHHAEIKADKIMAKARENSHRIKARAHEDTEKAVADALTRAERWKAEIEETKKKELAEIVDRVQQMIAIGELPNQEHKGVVQRMKKSLSCHT